MESAPVLGREAIRAAVEAVFREKRGRSFVALFGAVPESDADGWVELVPIGGAGGGEGTVPVKIVPVRSELELRAKLPPVEDEDSGRHAFLVPWSRDVPLDLAGRFAMNGRVRPVGKELRLAAMFGVARLDDAARSSRLGAWLLGAGGGRVVARLGGHTLTRDAMWQAWLQGVVGLDAAGGVGLDALVAFAATHGNGPEVAAAMGGPEGHEAREELLAWLAEKAGVAAPWVWRAWEKGRGAAALEAALLFEPLIGDTREQVQLWLKITARELMKLDAQADAVAVAAALGGEAAAIGRAFERGGEPGRAALRAGAREADERVVEPEVRAWLVESPRLPSAWVGRLERLGAALSEGVKALASGAAAAREGAARAVAALKGLEGHVAFVDAEHRVPLARAEMATRLLCWLAAGEVPEAGLGHTPYADAEALGRWYVAEGGWVDRARHLARGALAGALDSGIAAVLEAADARREALDLRFAKAVVRWMEAGQPATQVLPIQSAVERVAKRFLDGEPQRRLLVVLMDGMAWAQATELLASLAARAAPWGPLRWHVSGPGRIGEGPLPVVLAAMPTITEASRKAFFAGKVPWQAAGTVPGDAALWERCSPMMPFGGEDQRPKLLLRGESHTGAGGASQEALALVGDETRRVVAVVVNAIDDALKSSHAVRHPWGVDNIASLGALLDKAREAGRSVLLASDHGHVPEDRLSYVATGNGAGGARWRAWPAANAPVEPWEVALSGGLVMKPPGAHGVVLVADDRHRYTAASHAGEHGGATLAEVVAPCVLIGCEEAPAVLDDDALRPMPLAAPRWWHLETEAVQAGRVVVDAAPAGPKGKAVPEAQLTLLGIVEKPATAAPASAPPGRAAALAKSDVWKALGLEAARAEKVLKAVDVLLARHGTMSSEAFAAEMEMMEFRVPGFVTRLGEALNLDGFGVIRFDAGTRQVVLNAELLRQVFGGEP